MKRLSVVIILIVCASLCTTSKVLTKLYLEHLISANVEEALSYDFPQDNSEYFNNMDGVIYEYGVFDFIIVGAGSSGSVLANRLSEINSWSVLLLEAGNEETDFTEIPAMSGFLQRSKYNWGYNTTSQKFGCKGMLKSQCSYPRGKILGGSSSINGLIYTRGVKEDYDLWEKVAQGWGYEDVLPYFKKLEQYHIPADEDLHGYHGPISVNYSEPYTTLQEIFENALNEYSINYTDYNGYNPIGVSRIQSNIKHGKRVSGGNSYIKPARNRNNLNVTTDSLVTKILTDENKNAFAVLFVKDSKYYVVYCRNEIILSAGAINTPQILMLSGIGPEHILNKYNIPSVRNLPVGEYLIDQIAFNLQFKSNLNIHPDSFSKQLDEYLNGIGLLTAPFNGKSLAFIDTDQYGRISTEYVLIPPSGGPSYSKRNPDSPYISSVTSSYAGKTDPKSFFSMIVILLHPKSKGKVSIKSARPVDFPLIDSRILEDKDDIEDLYQAIQFAINLTQTEIFKDIKTEVFAPIEPCFMYPMYSKDYWYCAIEYMALPTYHSMGTTLMGKSHRHSVVDEKLKVHGVNNLRVVDCGVIPVSLSAHTNGPAFMIGEKASDIIKNDYNVIPKIHF